MACFCSSCGAPMEEDSSFCSRCGAEAAAGERPGTQQHDGGVLVAATPAKRAVEVARRSVPLRARPRSRTTLILPAVLLLVLAASFAAWHFWGVELSVSTNSPGARVLLDGTDVGRTDAVGAIVLRHVRRGSHTLAVAPDGQHERAEHVELRPSDFKFAVAFPPAQIQPTPGGAPDLPVAATPVQDAAREFAGCPGEGGCVFRTWRAKEPLPLYGSGSTSAGKVATLRAGERVTGLSAFIRVLQPGRCVARRAAAVGSRGETRIPAGTELPLYYFEGEGWMRVGFQGRTISISGDNFDCHAQPMEQVWVQVRTSSGITGWSPDRDKFEGTTQYDELQEAAQPAVSQAAAAASAAPAGEVSSPTKSRIVPEELLPANSTREFENESFYFRYPRNWQVQQAGQGQLVIGPVGCRRGNDSACGIHIVSFTPTGTAAGLRRRPSLQVVAEQVRDAIMRGNPGSSLEQDVDYATLGNRDAKSFTLRSTSWMRDAKGQSVAEWIRVVVGMRDDGSAVYVTFVAPEPDLPEFEGPYRYFVRNFSLD